MSVTAIVWLYMQEFSKFKKSIKLLNIIYNKDYYIFHFCKLCATHPISVKCTINLGTYIPMHTPLSLLLTIYWYGSKKDSHDQPLMEHRIVQLMIGNLKSLTNT